MTSAGFTSPSMGEVAKAQPERVGVKMGERVDRFRRKNAQRMRADPTDAEAILWSQLWRIPIEGSHFRRQATIGNYIADFASHRLKLVIELDGHHHAQPDMIARDAARTKWLSSQGYKVIRFANVEVIKELHAVLDTIYATVEERRTNPLTPPRR